MRAVTSHIKVQLNSGSCAKKKKKQAESKELVTGIAYSLPEVDLSL